MFEELLAAVRLTPRLYKIGNTTFTFHYCVTFTLLICASVFVTFVARFSKIPVIKCIFSSENIVKLDPDFVDHSAWIMGTYTVENCSQPQQGIAYPGVFQSHPGSNKKERSHIVYTWIGVLLVVQAISFYCPYQLWKYFEDGHVRMLVGKNTGRLFGVPQEDLLEAGDKITSYLRGNFGHYSPYFFCFCSCELLNLVNLLAQIFISDKIFRFKEYGPALIKHWSTSLNNATYDKLESPLEVKSCSDPVSPMDLYFPLVTKLRFQDYGPSGNIQPHDGLCVLTLNSVHRLIFAFFWFWFALLLILTMLSLVYRIGTILSSRMRFVLLQTRLPTSLDGDLALLLCNNIKRGDWFVLYQLAKNLNSEIFGNVVTALALDLQKKMDKK